jgi:hypothetical protein
MAKLKSAWHVKHRLQPPTITDGASPKSIRGDFHYCSRKNAIQVKQTNVAIGRSKAARRALRKAASDAPFVSSTI